ncbi:uncharacterized protein LOC127241699 [Andrographis paniculata]|uniref:uncharacterized protein LOC127241699 n=1 Tax=Andrographis paniculata TaxID=175694 RepID=UPI0021E6D8C7|nr:uncharacterized protein LOC127241699 [Andrographis paniculata]
MASSDSQFVLIDGIPNHIAEIILQKLWTVDRIRVRTVSKAWNATLRQLPPSEPPWKILSNSFDQETNSKKINLLSPSKKQYTFKYPNNGQCCCGSSRGWLFIGGGGDMVAEIGKILLWNPLSGEIRNLPPLSSLQFFKNAVNACLGLGLNFLSCYVTRVHVFSTNSGELAAAMIFGFQDSGAQRRLIICTPDDPQWTAVDMKIGNENPMDVLFHRGKLIFFCNDLRNSTSVSNGVIGYGRRTVSLINGGEVDMEIVTMVYSGAREGEIPPPPPPGFSLHRGVFREDFLVAAASGEMLLVSATVDRQADINDQSLSYKLTKIGGVEVHQINLCRGSLPAKLRSIGRQAVFVGGGCDAVSTSVNGIDNGEALNDFIYFTENGMLVISTGARGNGIIQRIYTVQQRGKFNVQNGVVYTDFISYFRTKSKLLGWFVPKI